MALTRKMLKAMGIEDEKVDQIIEAHTETTDALKSERDRYKATAEQLPAVQAELKKAQDIGFTGIANITAAYKYTHVDVRDGKWFGDETKGSKSVTTDFYQYFGVTRKENTPTTPTVTIKKGDSGSAVKWLQTRLAEKGYLRSTEIDGSFGKITLGAVCAFQLENGLEVDGICGPKTKAKLL